jgi:hypothetical protein
MIPPFTVAGVLPDGVFEATWAEFTARFGGTARRKVLLTGLRAALEALRLAGGTLVYVDGSFVSTEPEPGDWDACWEEQGVDFEHLDPILLTFTNARSGQKAMYLGEMFPAHNEADGDGTTFLQYFRRGKDLSRKGIVAIDVRRLG